MSRAGILALGLVVAATTAGAQGVGTVPPASRAPIPARADVFVRPDTATVGDPVTILARVVVPAGATVEFPVVVGIGADVDALDPRLVRSRAGGNETIAEATWRVVGWRPGTHALPLGEAVVTLGAQQWKVALETRQLVVRSVLPADTAKRAPRPARDLILLGAPWYDRWWLVAIAVVVVLFGRRAWTRRRSAQPPAPEVAAMASFDRLQAMGLAGAGEPAREVALAAEIVRAAIEGRWPDAGRGLTTGQVSAVAHRRIGPLAGDLAALLVDADLVKFARRPVTAEAALAFTVRARRVLSELGERLPRTGKAA